MVYIFLPYQSHRAFLSYLKTITIMINPFETLRGKRWEDVMKVEMKSLVRVGKTTEMNQISGM